MSSSDFYKVDAADLLELEKLLPVPAELKTFYSTIGYGFLNKGNGNNNRLLGPGDYASINLLEDDYEDDPQLDYYDGFYSGNGKVIFFEINAGSYLVMDIEAVDGKNAVYYFDKKIASSLEEFIRSFNENPDYFNS